MLLIDGVRYEFWTPTSEDDLEKAVIEHIREIFGKDCLYFVRAKLKAASVAAIPDAFVITFSPDRWWIVEVELSTHDVYSHIQNQVGKFVAALPHGVTRLQVRDALWGEIARDEIKKLTLRQHLKGEEIHKWLSDLTMQPPELAIIIDEKAPGLDDAMTALKITPKVVEFATYQRQGVGLAVHAHLFEPLFEQETALTLKSSTEVVSQDPPPPPPPEEEIDTIVVPALEDGFNETFLGENRWYAVRIHRDMKPHIKYIAAYRVAPVSAITYVAKVESIEPYKDTKKFVINFTEKAQKIGPIPLVPKEKKGKVKALQNLRYTTFAKLSKAKTLDEAF